MKRTSLVILLSIFSNFTYGQRFMPKQVPYETSYLASITKIATDNDKDLLLAGATAKQQSIIQKLSSNGTLKWTYLLTGADRGSVSPKIADLYTSSGGTYIVCANSFGARSNAGSAVKIFELGQSGKLISNHSIDVENPYKGNSNVHKCWEKDGKIYLVGSIFGGTNFNSLGNIGSIYWLQILDKERNIVSSRLIPSRIPLRANIVEVTEANDEILIVAENGEVSELVKFNAEKNEVFYSSVVGKANLIIIKNRINTISQVKGKINLLSYDTSLVKNSSSEFQLEDNESVHTAFSTKNGGLGIILLSITGAKSKLRMLELDSSHEITSSTTIGVWAPPAVFSNDSAQMSDGNLIFQFYQRISQSAEKFQHFILKVKKS